MYKSIFENNTLFNVSNEKVVLPYPQNYGCYNPLVENGSMEIETIKFLAICDLEPHIDAIINILRDGIEHPYIQHLSVYVIFSDNKKVRLNIIDYLYNLFFWNLIVSTQEPIVSKHIFFHENIDQKVIKKYIDNHFIKVYRKRFCIERGIDPEVATIMLNITIDNCLKQFFKLDAFSLWLADTINIEDDILLMNQNPEFYDLYHTDLSDVPLEDVQAVGMIRANRAIEIIKQTDHCLADSFRASQGINAKQYKEYAINIGTAPTGTGTVFPITINNSFINGGTNNVAYQHIESSKGRAAQIIAKCNVGKSGHFARLLSLNNREQSFLHQDHLYDCGSRNFQEFFIETETHLSMMVDRYYRLSENGVEHLLKETDTHLIGKTIYLRSPMTCASASRGRGVCYKCYGDLAFNNSSINIGQIAASILSAALTQRELSAKHLLEAMVRKMEWSPIFSDLFDINLNIISLYEDQDYSGWRLILNKDEIEVESEEDDFEYNEYVTTFMVSPPDSDEMYPVNTIHYDKVYLSDSINEYIRTNSKIDIDEGLIIIDMDSLKDEPLFLMDITNIEYSHTLAQIKSTINKEKETTSYDRHQLLQQFVNTIINGNLGIQSVHLEIILSNQLRNADNILLNPNWDNLNEPYTIITLNRALTDNPSITVSMNYQKLSRVLYNPLSFKKSQPSFLDLLFMKNPQEMMLNKNLVSDEYKPKEEKEKLKTLFRVDNSAEE